MKPYFPYVFVVSCVAALAVGQLVFKIVASRLNYFEDLWDLRTAFLFAFAMLLYVSSTIAWIAALRVLPLSQAYVFMSLAFILVPLGAHLFLGEPLTLRIVVGSLIVIVGVVVSVS